MYLPDAFKNDDAETLFGFIEANSFGTLITICDGELCADHLPFLLRRGEDGATLVSHVARANPVLNDLQSGQPCLVIFTGPHGYISPTWYRSDDTVPTWNYTAVHVVGVPRVMEDPAELRTALEETAAKYEPAQSEWGLSKVEHKGHLFEAIAGFQIPILSLHGKFKLSQNRAVADVERVLDAGAPHISPELQAFMRAELDKRR